MKNILFVIAFSLASLVSVTAQESTAYQYIVVPDQFEFFKGRDTYNLNTITKLQLEKYGFETFFPSEVPNDMNRCDALYADVEESSSLFATSLVILLRDCNGFEVLRSSEGRSKEKNIQVSYTRAFKQAFEGFEDLVQMIPPKTPPVKVTSKDQTSSSSENDEMITDAMEMPTAVSDVIFTAGAYKIKLEEGEYKVWYQDEIIGKLKSTSIANSFIAATTRFTGIAQRTQTGFKVEGEVPGSSEVIVLDFIRQ